MIHLGKTPTEQAERIINTYKSILIDIDSNISEEILLTIAAKNCSLVAVDLIEKTPDNKLFWSEVVEEINKH